MCTFRSLVIAALVLSGVASPATSQAVRDSAGIRIVTNERPMLSARDALRLADAPSLVIGTDTSPAQRLRRIRGVYRLSDGRVVVANGATKELRFYDPQGTLQRVSAVANAMPSARNDLEFLTLLRGDSLLVHIGLIDQGLFSGNGDFVRMFAGTPRSRETPPSLTLGALRDGTRVMAPFPRPAQRAVGTVAPDSISLRMVDRDLGHVADLGSHPYITLRTDTNGPRSVWLSDIGVWAGDDRAFHLGFGDRYEIKSYDLRGTLRTIIRRTWTPTPVTPEEWERWVVEWSRLWITSSGDSARKEMQELRDAPYAERLPAFSQFIADRVGRLWIRQPTVDDAIGAGSFTDPPPLPSTWSVFDREGRWLCDVVMPKEFQPYDIGADYVAGKQPGRFNNATAVIYPLIGGARRN